MIVQMNAHQPGYHTDEGEHAGHWIVRDAWGVDIEGRDPAHAFYCMDCRERLTADIVEEGEDGNEQEAL